MIRLKNSSVIFLLILIQASLAVSAGFIVLYLTKKQCIPPGAYVEDIHIGGMSRKEATERLEKHYREIMRNGVITVKIEGDREFAIKFEEIDAELDYKATVDSAFRTGYNSLFLGLISGYFRTGSRSNPPVVKINEWKLEEKLKEMSVLVDREPVDANIYIKDGKLVKIAETNGLKLNPKNSCDKIKHALEENIHATLELKPSSSYEIETVYPRITLKDLEGVEDIIAEYSTEIGNPDNMGLLIEAARAINKVMLCPADEEKGLEADEFSFQRYIPQKNEVKQEENEGVNQVASTLYAAVLASGIDRNAIMRIPHRKPVEYIKKGLDARVNGTEADFRFVNTLKNKVVIFSEVEDNKLYVTLAGKKADPQVDYVIKTDIVQKFSPPVINVESQDLKPGQRKLISPGREGFKVNVYRITSKNGIETERELISTDIYEATLSVVNIGPDTDWTSDGDK